MKLTTDLSERSEMLFEFLNGQTITCVKTFPNGIEIECSNGTLQLALVQGLAKNPVFECRINGDELPPFEAR